MVAERTKAFRPLRGRDGKPSRRTSTKTKTIWWPQRDSNPRLGLERASPWVVISPTSAPGATSRRHSRRNLLRGCRPLTKTPGGAKATLLLLLLEGGAFPRGLPAFLLAHGAISLRTTARKGGVTLSSVRYSSATHQRCASQQVRLQPSGQTET